MHLSQNLFPLSSVTAHDITRLASMVEASIFVSSMHADMGYIDLADFRADMATEAARDCASAAFFLFPGLRCESPSEPAR